MNTKSITATVGAGRKLKMSDLHIQRVLIKRMNQQSGAEFAQMIRTFNDVWDKHRQTFTF